MSKFIVPIKPDASRLDILATEFRRARAVSYGLTEDIADLRVQAENLRRRIALTRMSGVGNGPYEKQLAEEKIAEIEPVLSSLLSRISDVETEQREAASEASTSRANLTAAVEAAKFADISVPPEVEEMIK